MAKTSTMSEVLKNWKKRDNYINKLERIKNKLDNQRCVVCNNRIPPSRIKQFKNRVFGIKTCSSQCSHKNMSNQTKLWKIKNKELINKRRRNNK
jgi:hypothetical protein